MIRPNGSKVVKLRWLEAEILILMNETQLKSYKKLNKIPNNILKINKILETNGYASWIQEGVTNYFFIYLKVKNIRIISHEVAHCIGHLFECFGLEGKKGGETYAYLLGHITDEICKMTKTTPSK